MAILESQASAKPSELSALENIRTSIESARDSVTGCAKMLNDFGDRAFGVELKGQDESSVRPVPVGRVGETQQALEQLEDSIKYLRDRIQRIQKLT